MNSDALLLIVGIPLSDFPEPPSNQPGCELIDCSKCSKQMWLSEFKRNMLAKEQGILVQCWHCFAKLCTKLGYVPGMITKEDYLKLL